MTDTPAKTSCPITVDGLAVEAQPGELLIAAAERAGTYIPRFCYHPRMKPVGMCRMCLVEVDTGRGPALQPSCMLDGGRRHERRHRVAGGEEGPGRRARVPPDQPPARLPGVRQGRRVPAAGPDAGVRPRREPLRRGEASLGEADRALRARGPGPRAVHPVRPLHAVRRRGGRRPADLVHQPGQRDRGQHVPRRPLRVVLQRQHRADLPGRRAHGRCRTASRPARGTSTRSSRRARRARSAAASRCSRRRTGWSATSASTSTRSTRAGCATRAASTSRPSTARSPPRQHRWSARATSWRRRRGPRRSPRRPMRSPAKERHGAAPRCSAVRLTNEDAYAWSKLARTVLGTDNVDASSATACRPRSCSAAAGHDRRGVRGRCRRAAHRRPQGGAARPVPAPPPRRGRRLAPGARDRSRSAGMTNARPPRSVRCPAETAAAVRSKKPPLAPRRRWQVVARRQDGSVRVPTAERRHHDDGSAAALAARPHQRGEARELAAEGGGVQPLGRRRRHRSRHRLRLRPRHAERRRRRDRGEQEDRQDHDQASTAASSPAHNQPQPASRTTPRARSSR